MGIICFCLLVLFRTTTWRRQWKWEIFLRNFVEIMEFGLLPFLESESMFSQEGLANSSPNNFYYEIPVVLMLLTFVFWMCPCSVSSLAWFMSNQETSFVTIGQRVLAYPLKWVAYHSKLFPSCSLRNLSLSWCHIHTRMHTHNHRHIHILCFLSAYLIPMVTYIHGLYRGILFSVGGRLF